VKSEDIVFKSEELETFEISFIKASSKNKSK
jgi:hypothetical protein